MIFLIKSILTDKRFEHGFLVTCDVGSPTICMIYRAQNKEQVQRYIKTKFKNSRYRYEIIEEENISDWSEEKELRTKKLKRIMKGR